MLTPSAFTVVVDFIAGTDCIANISQSQAYLRQYGKNYAQCHPRQQVCIIQESSQLHVMSAGRPQLF